jgi:hypothetical protein
MQTWDILTLLGLGWEAYLLMSDDSDSSAVNSGNVQSPFIPQLAFQTHPYGTQTVLRWKRSF